MRRQGSPPMRNGQPHMQQQQQQHPLQPPQQQRQPSTLHDQGRRPSAGPPLPQTHPRAFRQGGPDGETHPHPADSFPLRDLQQPAPPVPAFYQSSNSIRSSNQFNNHHYDHTLNGLDSEDELSQPNRRDTLFSTSSQNSLFQNQDSGLSDGKSCNKEKKKESGKHRQTETDYEESQTGHGSRRMQCLGRGDLLDSRQTDCRGVLTTAIPASRAIIPGYFRNKCGRESRVFHRAVIGCPMLLDALLCAIVPIYMRAFTLPR